MEGMNGISAVGSTLDGIRKASGNSGNTDDSSFANVLKDTIDRSESQNTQSNVDLLNLLSGNTDDLSGLMVDSQKAEIAVSLTAAIRNKAMDAYKEIMTMQV